MWTVTLSSGISSAFPGISLSGSSIVATSSMTQLGVGGALVHDVTGLTAGQAYYMRVHATNSVGSGPA